MRKSVTRCVCHRVTFEELRDYARETGKNLDDLIAEKKCCGGCQMCRPYVEKMMHTGETAFRPGDFYINDDK